MAKRGLDQSMVWILSFVGTVVLFTGLYFGTKHVSENYEAQKAAERLARDSESNRTTSNPPASTEEEFEDNTQTSSNSSPNKPTNSLKEKAGVTHAGTNWSYKGSLGPEHWGDLSDLYLKCSDGKKQSPIDIDQTRNSSKLLPLKFVYNPTEISLHHNGHTIQGNYGPGSHLEIDGDPYSLIQFHLHTPSEHRMQGIQYDAEIHLVHKNRDGNIAFVALLIEEGAENSAVKSLWQDLPKLNGDRSGSVEFSASSLLPKNRSYFHYVGSLTTPPCSENVRWYVIKRPIEMSANQIDRVVRLLRFNARPVQSLNGRVVLTSAR
jgi:carbonic anhydrase